MKKLVDSLPNGLFQGEERVVNKDNVDQINKSTEFITQSQEEVSVLHSLEQRTSSETACFNDYDNEEAAIFFL